jgi:coat protein B
MKYFGLLVALCMLVVMSVVPSFAVMSPADITATTTGISDSLSLFYTIGGAILVVCAAIWGFRKVKGLLGA